MSLKSFHLVFVTVCALLFAFLTLWSFVISPETSTMITVLGYVGIVGILLTAVYGVYFQRKAQRIHI
jgi:hypothetical protein